MGKQGVTKRKKVPGELRGLLARNVQALMDHQYAMSRNKPLALAKAAGMPLSTVQRVLNQATGASVEVIEKLANAFDVIPFQLFIPGLDVRNPQMLRELSDTERAMYKQIEDSKATIAGLEKQLAEIARSARFKTTGAQFSQRAVMPAKATDTKGRRGGGGE